MRAIWLEEGFLSTVALADSPKGSGIGGGAAGGWLQAYRTQVLFAASLLATIPVWIATYPPMTDLPQHAAQVTLLRALHDPHFAYANLFQTNWLTPYLSGYLLIYVLAPIVGIVFACKIVISLALAALPLSTALVIGETGIDTYWALLAIPALYGINYHWGLLNFIVATPAGMIFLWLMKRHLRAPGLKSLLFLALLINALFFCHALICLFFGMIAAGCTLLEKKTFKDRMKCLAPLAAVLPVMGLWFLKASASPLVSHRSIGWDLGWFNVTPQDYYAFASWASRPQPGWGRVTGFFSRLLGTRPDVLWDAYGIVLFALPFLAGLRPSRRLKAWLPFLLCVGALLLMPNFAFDASFLYARFTVFALPFWLMALEPAPTAVPKKKTRTRKLKREQGHPAAWLTKGRIVATAATCLVVLWITVVSVYALQFNSAVKGFDEVLARMEPGQRALSLMPERENEVAIAPAFIHFAAWYAAQKSGVVDPSFANGVVALVIYRPGRSPALPHDFEWNAGEFQWQRNEGESYRYFVVHWPEDVGPILFHDATCPVHLRYQENHWWLYEKDPGCPAKPASFNPPDGAF